MYGTFFLPSRVHLNSLLECGLSDCNRHRARIVVLTQILSLCLSEISWQEVVVPWHKLHQCYKCAGLDSDEKCRADSSYRFSYSLDGGLECLEEDGTCKKTLCQCDREYLIELEDVISNFDPAFHIQGGFDRAANCHVKTANEPDLARKVKLHDCCGAGINRVVYRPALFDCCEDGTVQPVGEC